MRSLQGTLYLSVVVFLVALAPLQASAAPWRSLRHSADKGPTPQPSPHNPFGQCQDTQLGWLRISSVKDLLVQKLFQSPSPPPLKTIGQKAGHGSRKSSLPSTLLAQYGGDVVLRFNLSSAYEENALAEAADSLFMDVWEFTNNWADIRLREVDVPSLLGLLPESLQLSYSTIVPDLAQSIYNTYPSKSSKLRNGPVSLGRNAAGMDDLFFSEYQPLPVIHRWMSLLEAMYNTHVQLISIGTSFEGRDIKALKVGITSETPSSNPRKTIIISGGLHAREWISVSTVTYTAWSMISSYGISPGITKLLQEFDFVFIPTMNPDGYAYTWDTDRLWRKNRQKTKTSFCLGVDLDRSFGFEWDEDTDQTNPCSENYQGETPFQAVESQRLAEWTKNESENNNVHFIGFLDFHSYSQQVLYPYSYSCNADPPSLENLEELGLGIAKAIRISSGEQYSVASACEGAVASKLSTDGRFSRMETGGGSAIDWFYHELRVRYSYQVKLRDTGSYGFLLPKENIVPTGEEAFNAVKYFGDYLLGNKGIERYPSEADVESKIPNPSREMPSTTDEVEAKYEFEANMELRRR